MKALKTTGIAVVAALIMGWGQVFACGEGKVQSVARNETQKEQKVCPFTGQTSEPVTKNTDVRFVTVANNAEVAQAQHCSQSCNATSVVSALAVGMLLIGGMVLGVQKLKI
jgi:hypothetical protein